jgi:uncharacterized membrane protein YfcA
MLGGAAILGVLVGGVSFGFAGFAFALFSNAALTLSWPPQIAIPAVMLLADTMTVPLLWAHRAHLRADLLRQVPPFAPWSIAFLLAGVVAGAVLLGRAGPAAGRVALGIVILVFVGFQVRRSEPAPRARGGSPAAAWGAAAAGGLLDGWLGTGGVAIAMYLAWRRLEPGAFIAALLAYFLVSDVLRVVNYTILGYWATETFALYLRVLPIALAGYGAGIALRRRFGSPSVFRAIVLALLVVYALALLARTLVSVGQNVLDTRSLWS